MGENPDVIDFFQAAGCAGARPGAGWSKVASLELPRGSAQLIPFISIQVRQLPDAF